MQKIKQISGIKNSGLIVTLDSCFRFGHSLVDDILMQRPANNLTLLNSFNKPNILKQPGTRPSQFLQSLTVASSQDTDEYMVPTLTNNLFGTPRFPIGLDLYALNVMVRMLIEYLTQIKNIHNWTLPEKKCNLLTSAVVLDVGVKYSIHTYFFSNSNFLKICVIFDSVRTFCESFLFIIPLCQYPFPLYNFINILYLTTREVETTGWQDITTGEQRVGCPELLPLLSFQLSSLQQLPTNSDYFTSESSLKYVA